VALHAPRGNFNDVPPEAPAALLFGEGVFDISSVERMLRLVGLPLDAPLTTLAVEVFRTAPDPNPAPDPLGADLGFARILRLSPVSAVPNAC
jgi:hypothetical protein